MEKPEGVSLRDPAPMSIGGAGSFGKNTANLSPEIRYYLSAIGGSDAQTVARPSPGSRQRDRGA
ncbi:MAG: hypothetical protein QME16_04530 [Planctomycetota bacterium]|nr:hypothetical protein [Planctomycetota bacterium]